MDQHSVQGGVVILLGMLHTKETQISFGHLGLWLMCAFTFFTWVQDADCGFALGIACKQALRGTLAAGQEKEGELPTMSLEFEFHLHFPCGSLRTELSIFCQSARSRNEGNAVLQLFLETSIHSTIFYPFFSWLNCISWFLVIILSVPSTYHFPFGDHFINILITFPLDCVSILFGEN